MPARKNRPDKCKGSPKTSVKTPAQEMAVFVEQNPGYRVKSLGHNAWEVYSHDFSIHGGVYTTVSWDGQTKRWAATHNAIHSPGDRHFMHPSVREAVSWYERLCERRQLDPVGNWSERRT